MTLNSEYLSPLIGHNERLMIDSIKIRNFRSFESLSISGCKRLNVILGRNASGKTALLEALFMALGNSPELAQRMRLWRSMPSFLANNSAADRELWSDLFHNFDLSKHILIAIEGRGGHDTTLSISYDETVGLSPHSGTGFPMSPIKFEYKRANMPAHTARAIMTPGQISYDGGGELKTEVVFFSSQLSTNIPELVERFSFLGRQNGQKRLLEVIRKEFDFIDDIEVFTLNGNSNLFIRTNTSKTSIPIGLVSSGVTKIVSILTAIAVFSGGVILIDEIENGIYFDRYESLWRAIYDFALENNVQIFTSSHSDECLRALARVAADWQQDVSFMRFNKPPHGVEQFHGSTIFGAMEIGEVR